jgi:type I restriction enzyme S subunit
MSDLVPEGWSIAKIGDAILSAEGGVSVNSENRQKTNKEFGVLKTSSVVNGRFYPAEHKAILNDEVGRASTNPKKDHILFSRMNTPILVGQSGFVDKDYNDLFLPDRLWQIKVANQFHPKWLSYTLRSQDVVKHITDAATGTSNTMKNIAKPNLMAIPMRCPPLPEQQKIAAILSSVDEVIEKTQAQINKLKDLKTGMMQELLSPREGQTANINNPQGESKNGLHHTEFKDSPLGRIPVGWEVVPLGDKASLVPGYAFSSTDFTKNGTPLIRMGNLYQNRLDLKRAPKFMHKDLIEKHPRFVVSPNDIVFSMTGTSGKEDYGFAVQIPNTAPICLLNQRVAKVVPSKEITKSFLLHLLHSRLFLDEVYSAGAGTKQANLSSANILDIKLPFPPIEEQEKIANALNSVSERISVINKRLNALSFSKKALMQDLLTGKVRVKVD